MFEPQLVAFAVLARTSSRPGIIALVEISGVFGSNSLQVKAHRWSFSEAMLFVATEAAQTLPL